MKKYVLITAVLFLLTGCSNQNPPEAIPKQQVSSIVHPEGFPFPSITPEMVPTGKLEKPQRPQPTPRPTEDLSTKVVSALGLDNTTCGWGMKKNENAPPDIPSETKELLKKYNGYYMGDSSEKVLYLTFDEGYENGYTAQILDVLKENQVPAAFFITGPYLEKEGALVERMVKEGHIVGNHSINHPSLPDVGDDEVAQELKGLEEKFQAKYKMPMKYVRPPRGEYSERTLAITKQLGYTSVFWSFAYKDWDVNSQQGADYAYQQVMPYLHDGAILLLHAVSSDNANALDRILKEAKNQGYTFKSLDELN